MKNDFIALCDFMGYGEPNKSIWFIGLEEAGELNKDDPEYELKLQRYQKQFFCSEIEEIEKESIKYGKRFTKIYDIMSKIIVWSNYPSAKFYTDWKKYRNEKLLQEGSKIFQTNLYPIGKVNSKIWTKKHVEISGYNGIKEYKNFVKEYRFPKLKEFWEKSNPIISICFGKQQNWKDFKELFDIQKTPDIIKNYIHYYREKRLIFTPFFVNHQMNTERIHEVVEILKKVY